MAVCDARELPGFLTPILTQLSFQKPRTAFLTIFSRGERQKLSRKGSLHNRVWNSQPSGHESDMHTTEPPERAAKYGLKSLVLDHMYV